MIFNKPENYVSHEISVTRGEELKILRALREVPEVKRPSLAKDLLCDMFGGYSSWVAHLLVEKANCVHHKAKSSAVRRRCYTDEVVYNYTY